MSQSLGPADLYELRTRSIAADRRMIETLARGKSVLEVGCGTGRILAGLVGQGAQTLLGVEIDQDRLAIARQKASLSQAPELTLVHANFLEFECPFRFDWVLFAFNVLAEFPTVADRIAAIRRAATLLEPDGRILVVTHMHDFADFARSEVTHEFRVPAEDGDWQAVLKCTRTRVDQLSSCEIVYRNAQMGEIVRDAWRSALTTRNELLAIFAAAGVVFVEEYGDFAFQPLSEDSSTLVQILRRIK